MTFVLDEAGRAIRQTPCDLLRDMKRKGAVSDAVPKTDWHIHIFQPKAPRFPIDSRIANYSFRRAAPGIALTLKANIEGHPIAQRLRVGRR